MGKRPGHALTQYRNRQWAIDLVRKASSRRATHLLAGGLGVVGGIGLGPVRAPLVVLQERLEGPDIIDLGDLLFLAIDDDFVVLRGGNRLLGLLQNIAKVSRESRRGIVRERQPRLFT
jgi:hypothetical protein